MEEQLEDLRNNVNAHINILRGKTIQNLSFACEIGQSSHFSGECSGGGILWISEEIEHLELPT